MLRYLLLAGFAAAAASAADSVRVVEIDNRLVSYTVQDGFAITQGDVILGPAEEVENYRAARARGESPARPRAIYSPGANNSRLWPNATMYYTLESDVPAQQNLQAAIDYWNTVSPFQMLPRGSESNYVTFRRTTGDFACSSSVGMVGGQQYINVTTACSTGNAIHEIGHAWGMQHEQARPDRNTFLTVLYDHIDKRYYNDFYQALTGVSGGYYDYDSIMHYPATGFATNFDDSIATVPVGIPIGQRAGLSAGDVDALTRLYGIAPTATTITTTPAGLSVVVDGQTVTTPRTFDWTAGSQHTVAAGPSQGAAPRYVFARWTDGGAAAHTITASPSTTVYCAQFQRQFPARAGLGSGSGTATMRPAPADGYLADRQSFTVTATPAAGSKFVRWSGTTSLGAAGLSVSANPATPRINGLSADYQATFTTGAVHVVDSAPRGVFVTVDGSGYYTPVSFAWAAGSTHTVTFVSPNYQGNNTRRHTFTHWENGSTDTPRTLTATAEGATFTAMFQQQFLLSTSTVGGGTIQATPPSPDGFYDANTTVTLKAVPSSGQTLRYWVGDLVGNSATATLVMNEDRAVLANFGTQLPWLMFHAATFLINPIPATTSQMVAPGEIVSIFGSGIGPAAAQSPKPGAEGRLPSNVDGVSVTFDEFAAPFTFASANQLNVVAPYGIAGRSSVIVTVRGPRGNQAFGIATVETAPGLFTYDGSGRGPVAALNQDGTINSEANPAAPGSVVVLYGTGAGVLEKSFADGAVMGAELVSPKAPVSVRFEKLAGEVLYAGAAPFLVNGALQINVKVPDGVLGGAVPIQVAAGTFASPPGTTIWIK